MTISIKPTSTETIIQQNGTDSLVFDNNGNVEGRQNLYPTVPAFRAYKGIVDQSLASSTWTKVTYDTVHFDTNSNFSTATSRFTPTVAGYYQINVTVSTEGASLTRFITAIYKNGVTYSRLSDLQVSSGTIGRDNGNSDIIYFNGTTDYIEIYSYQIGTPNLDSDPNGVQQVISGNLVSYKYIAPPSEQTPTESDNLQAFSGTGSDATWTVPSGVTRVLVKIWGAGGGHPTYGGAGGFTKGFLDVTAGETLTLRVGKTHTAEDSGTDCSGQCSGKDFIGGFGGGGRGREGNGGGGGSYIFRGGTAHSNVLAAAGGGGGAGAQGTMVGAPYYGGAGGGDSGLAGKGYGTYPTGGGGGGTQSSGGLGSPAGASGYSTTGSTYNGGTLQGGSIAGTGGYGGGGGGGYYGGGSGAKSYPTGVNNSWVHVGAGGGSGYSGGLTDVTTEAGSNYNGSAGYAGGDDEVDWVNYGIPQSDGRINVYYI
jgi:hypothetical protein